VNDSQSDATAGQDDRHAAVAEVEALLAGHRIDDAMTMARAALGRPDISNVTSAILRSTLASILIGRGFVREGIVEADAALATPALPERVSTAAQLTRLVGLMATGDIAAARLPAQDILAGKGQSISDGALAGALSTIAGLAWTEGRVADAVGLFRAAVSRVERGSPEAMRLHPRQSLAATLSALGEFDSAQVLLDEEREDVQRAGDTMWKAGIAARQARLDLSAGRLDDALTAAQAAVDLGEELGAELFVPLARTTVAAIALMRGDVSAAGEQLKRCRSARSLAGFVITLTQWLEGRLAEIVDGPARAADVLTPLYRDDGAQKRLIIEEPSSAPGLVRLAMAAGLSDRAELLAEAAGRRATENPGYPSMAAIAAHARGILRNDPDDLQQAAADHVQPYARGVALEDLGAALDDRGDRAGRAMLEASRDAFTELGAHYDARRVDSRLGYSNARRRRGPVELRPEGWARLTESERRVADLVADGLTNRQVAERVGVSPYTVDFHLRQIFRRLAVGSRVDLARLVFKQRGRRA
jgi:DNA-binding CsgD family transcriptional regulator/transcriptional regulator with XRE-family HTH domain